MNSDKTSSLKKKEFEDFLAQLKEFENRCGDDDVNFLMSAQRHREELENLWIDMHENEKKKENDLQFRMEMIELKNSFNDEAKEFNKWMKEKTKELKTKSNTIN